MHSLARYSYVLWVVDVLSGKVDTKTVGSYFELVGGETERLEYANISAIDPVEKRMDAPRNQGQRR